MDNNIAVMYTVNDIKKIFGCSKNKAYEIVNRRGFPKMRVGKQFYIPQKSFEEWVQKNTVVQ